jgi:hypothetical protein
MPVVSLLFEEIVLDGENEDRGVALVALRADNATLDNAGVALGPLWSAADIELPLFANKARWSLVLVTPSQEVAGGLLTTIRPGGDVHVAAGVLGEGGSLPDGKRGLGLKFKDPTGAPTTLLDTDFGTHWEFDEAFLNFGVDTKGGANGGFVEIGLKGGRIIVKGSEMGPFLGSVVGDKDITASFDVGIAFSTLTGLSFRGAGGLEIDLSLHEDFGIIRIDGARVSLSTDGGSMVLAVGANGAVQLGPVSVSVVQVGIALNVRGGRGNLGPVDVGLGFKLPSGVGISVDAGPVSGGGFLFFDEPHGRYGGALELKIYSVTVKAFGLIETKLPDGGKGFSFVIVISAEFTPIQLGLGFTLNGVGGVIGINRRIDADGLSAAVRSGSLEHLLFPHDVVHDAPQIIHDLQAVLPATDGRYVFGPMAKIGWGTPTIIEAELAIILELPGPRLALLGEVHALLPKKDKGLVTLNLSVAGLLDFPKKYLAIDASLHDSRVGSFPITGDMAMRLLWGDQPSFALAVGGFNPGFQPPPTFPTLRRVAVDLGISGNPSLTLQGYFALTSNSAQVGALAELKAHGAGIDLYGRVQFDAIFVFSPFSFEAAISASVRVSFHGHGIGVHLSGVLSGPSPWRVRGEVCVSILLWDACLSFDKSFGSASRVDVPAINPWDGVPNEVPGLHLALTDVRNWTPELPPAAFSVVSLADAPDGDPPLDPLGVAVVRERVCPLNLQIERFGSAKADSPTTFKLQEAAVNGTDVLSKVTFLKEPFAKAQFVQLSDAQKLSAPSFEPFDGAIRVPANDNTIASGSLVTSEIKYQTKILGAAQFDDHNLPIEHLSGMLKRSATGLFGLRRVAAESYIDPTAKARFVVDSEQFVIVDKLTFKTKTGILGSPANKFEAALALEQHLTSNPDDRDGLQVMPKFELGGR